MTFHIIFFSSQNSVTIFSVSPSPFHWESRTTFLLCFSSTTASILMSSLFGTKGKFPGAASLLQLPTSLWLFVTRCAGPGCVEKISQVGFLSCGLLSHVVSGQRHASVSTYLFFLSLALFLHPPTPCPELGPYLSPRDSCNSLGMISPSPC